jgi:magnesium-transporting ATPase (P-type)
VTSGEGVAVVCAVGPHTQYGMHMRSKYSVSMLDMNDNMKLASLLDEYLLKFTWFSYLISLFFLSYMLLYYSFFSNNYKPHSIEDHMLIFLNSFICTICLLIALVPEALFMAMTKSLGEFT